MHLNRAIKRINKWNQSAMYMILSFFAGIILTLPAHHAGAEALVETKGVQTAPVSDSPAQFVEFILEDEANCQSRDSQHVIVHNTHPTKTVRVWLDRYYRNVPTGDRSRTDLLPGAEPEGLGCATVMNAKQEWRVVKALFLE